MVGQIESVNEDLYFKKIVAWMAIISMPVAFSSTFLNTYWTNFNLLAFTAPEILLQEMGNSSWLIITFMLDLFGYYLPLIPLAIYIPTLLDKEHSGMVKLFTFSGLAYILCGSIGASLCISILPSLADSYLHSSGDEQLMYFTVFSAFFNGIFFGLWDLLDPILSGIWWLGIGVYLQRKWKVLGLVTMILGLFSLLTSVGYVVGNHTLQDIGLNFYLGLAPLWAFSMGVKILKER